MASNDKNDDYERLYLAQLEYFKYLFEQEQKRSQNLVNGAKMYIVVLIFIFGTVFVKLLPIDNVVEFISNPSISIISKGMGCAFLLLSILSVSISFIFFMLVFKVWRYERLCDPKHRIYETAQMKSNIDAMSKSITDFVVATSRNYDVNNDRAACLSRAILFLVSGLLFSLISLSFINPIVINGGII